MFKVIPRLDRLVCTNSADDDNDMFSGVWKASVSGLLMLPVAVGGFVEEQLQR